VLFWFLFCNGFLPFIPKKRQKKKKVKNSDGPIKVATKNDSPGTRFLDFGLDFGLF
jgi:hypothetical protein